MVGILLTNEKHLHDLSISLVVQQTNFPIAHFHWTVCVYPGERAAMYLRIVLMVIFFLLLLLNCVFVFVKWDWLYLATFCGSPDSKVHVSYFHHFATDTVVVRELFHFNLFQTSEQIDTKLGRYVQWKILNKVYAFFFYSARKFKMQKQVKYLFKSDKQFNK